LLYRFDEVRVAFAGREVLRSVSFQHNPGEKLVLLGSNGCGKTTLVRTLVGEQDVDSGSVSRARGLTFSFLEQRLDITPFETVLDFCLGAFARLGEVEAELAAVQSRLGHGDAVVEKRFHDLQEEFERLDGYRARPRAEAALIGLGIRAELHTRTLDALSGGERTRVALARTLLAPADLLVLDEPTNHLDLLGAEFLGAALAARDGALLLVTHDRDLVDRVGGEILDMHAGRVERYPAGYARYRREREARRAQRRKAWELQQAEIARQEEFIRRNMAGQNTKQAQSRQKLLARVERLAAPETDQPPLRLRWPGSARSGERVLDVEEVVVGWDAPLLRGVSLSLRRGERLAVIGRNGAGKTTILHTLAGRIPALGGRLRFGTGVVPGWYDQENAEVTPGMSVLAVLNEARPDWSLAEARAWGGRFGFSGEAADADTASLSGGERARLALARLIALAPNLMILDEPTNHLDVVTCEVLESALADFPGAAVIVSHDRRLLERVATHVLLIEGDGATALNSVADAFSRLGLAPAVPSQGREESIHAPRRSALEEERRRLRRDGGRAREVADELGAAVEASELRLREIDALLCEREVFSAPQRAQGLAREAEILREDCATLFDEWTAAEEDATALERRLVELDGED